MRIRLTIPPDLVSPATLGVALEASTRVAQAELARGRAPSIAEGIRRGVRWRPEPPGDESFDLPSDVMARGWGDCDDLAPWRAADLRLSGEDPRARAIAIPSGPRRWHAIVERSNGEREDPSRWAGMTHTVGQAAAVLAPLRPGRATILVGEGSGVRVDMPGRVSRGCPMGFAVTARNPDAGAALREAITGMTRIGTVSGLADPRALSLMRALYRFVCQSQDIRDALRIEGVDGRGLDLDTLARYAGRDHEVGILPCLAVIGGVVAGVAAVVSAVTPIVKAVIDAIASTAKAVEAGIKPIEDLYQQVRSAVDHGTIQMEHVRKTAEELRAQGHGAEADTLTREAMIAQERRNAREVQALEPGVVNLTELRLRDWRLALKVATEQAAGGDIPGARARALAAKQDVLAQSWLPAPGPAAIWESLALAYGLDPESATPPGGAWAAQVAKKAARIRGPAPGPAPAPRPGPLPAPQDDGEFVQPGLDALFRRAGAFM